MLLTTSAMQPGGTRADSWHVVEWDCYMDRMRSIMRSHRQWNTPKLFDWGKSQVFRWIRPTSPNIKETLCDWAAMVSKVKTGQAGN